MDFEDRLEKPKKRLTDKQLQALADGRKKQKIKREKEIIQETKTRQRKERLERERVLNEQEEIKIYNKLMKQGNDKIREWKDIKYKHLDKATTIQEYNELKYLLDQIDEEDVLTGTHIEKLQQGLEYYQQTERPSLPIDPIENDTDEEEELDVPNEKVEDEIVNILQDPRDI
jgi:hypothetical protein